MEGEVFLEMSVKESIHLVRNSKSSHLRNVGCSSQSQRQVNWTNGPEDQPGPTRWTRGEGGPVDHVIQGPSWLCHMLACARAKSPGRYYTIRSVTLPHQPVILSATPNQIWPPKYFLHGQFDLTIACWQLIKGNLVILWSVDKLILIIRSSFTSIIVITIVHYQFCHCHHYHYHCSDNPAVQGSL